MWVRGLGSLNDGADRIDKTRFLQDGAAIKATQPGENGVLIRTTPKMMGWEAGKSYALEAHTEVVSRCL